MGGMIGRIDAMFAERPREEVEAWMLAQRDEIRGDPHGDVQDYVAVCNELGSYYREQGRYEESLHNYGEALSSAARAFGGARTYEYALLLVNEAGTHRYLGDFERALGNYAQACEILESLGMNETYGYATLLNNRALALLDRGGEDDLAFALAMQAREIVGRTHAGQVQEAISYVNLASVALRAGRLDEALGCAQDALRIYDALGVESGHYPAAVNMMASVHMRKGDWRRALEGFERAAELVKRNFGENRDYAIALGNMAHVLGLMGESEAAAQCARRVEEVGAKLK